MEPPAVTSSHSSQVGGSNSNGVEKGRRATDFLQIDPSSTFISNSSRNFEELPENFLDTISPQQSGPVTSLSMHDGSNSSPQLAPLAPMSIGTESGSYSSMMNMSSQYHGGEGMSSIRQPLEKASFGNGPAGLLSPLHMDGRRQSIGSEYSRSVYIKQEETDMDGGHHIMMSSSQMSQQSEMDRIANAETPPAVSNVELASTMIASLIGDQDASSPSPHGYSSGPSGSSLMMQRRLSTLKTDEDSLDGSLIHVNGDNDGDGMYKSQYNQKAKRVYSTKDANDPLNAEIDDDIYIDTKELCKRIAYELKQHSIPQAIFAERILCRSQGTLSDLLRNPKPWNKLKSGRETFRRMFNWVQQPLATRLGILDMYNKDGNTENGGVKINCGMSPPTPAQNVRHHTRARHSGDGEPSNKRPRLVFTDIQKRTLQAIFKETQRPSREMQQTIAEHLRLDLSTVANFFMNARRRSRIGPNTNDEPAPYQQIRPITPPPDSPPRSQHPPRARATIRPPPNMSLIEQTVSGVAEEAIQYSRRLDEEAAASSLQNMHHMGAVSGGGGNDYKDIIKMDSLGDDSSADEDDQDESLIVRTGGLLDIDHQPPVVTYTVPDTDATGEEHQIPLTLSDVIQQQLSSVSEGVVKVENDSNLSAQTAQ